MRHSEVMFAGFLEDELMYRVAEQFWSRYWESLGLSGWTTPWFQNPFKDANPIFSAIKGHRGIRVLQHGHPDIVSYMDTFSDFGEPEFANELVISLGVTSRTMMLADSLIHRWVEGASVEMMKNLCHRAMNSL